jgi:hypothetical protein
VASFKKGLHKAPQTGIIPRILKPQQQRNRSKQQHCLKSEQRIITDGVLAKSNCSLLKLNFAPLITTEEKIKPPDTSGS